MGITKIKAFRTRYGLTQERLGEMLGVTKYAVCKWERTRRRPRGAVKKLFDRLEIEMYTTKEIAKRVRNGRIKLKRRAGC